MHDATIRIALDALPYEHSIFRAPDYSGEQVFSKVGLPLFTEKNDDIAFLGARSVKRSRCGKILDIEMHYSLFWENGDIVTARDYERTIRFLCKDGRNRFRTLFSDLDGFPDYTNGNSDTIGVSTQDSRTLRIQLRYPSRFMLHYLTLNATSPMHETRPSLSAGPYAVRSWDQDSIHLSKNPYYRLDDGKGVCDNICFIHIKSDSTSKLFFDKKLDVTCDTDIDYREICKLRQNRSFITSRQKLIMLLSAGNLFTDIRSEVKYFIIFALNRQAMAEELYNAPKPVHSYQDAYGLSSRKIDRKQKHSLKCENIQKPNQSIIVSYEDF